jgi:hypothetical protein
MSNLEGVIYHEKDREDGPFVLRQGGTNNFVTDITTDYYSRWGSPGEAVAFEGGWNNPASLSYPTMARAIEAATEAYRIEGFYIFIETKAATCSHLAEI